MMSRVHVQTHVSVPLLIPQKDSPVCLTTFDSGLKGQNQLDEMLRLRTSQGTLQITAFSLADLGVRLNFTGTLQSVLLGKNRTTSAKVFDLFPNCLSCSNPAQKCNHVKLFSFVCATAPKHTTSDQPCDPSANPLSAATQTARKL